VAALYHVTKQPATVMTYQDEQENEEAPQAKQRLRHCRFRSVAGVVSSESSINNESFIVEGATLFGCVSIPCAL
jgi:hypothetical protein